jgi:hypothetical protein
MLEELVQDVFRKRGLRPGQLPIISWHYKAKGWLLPTGGGKLLTFSW